MSKLIISAMPIFSLILSLSLSIHGLSAQSSSIISAKTQLFLNTLSPEELSRTNYEFSDSLRFKWTNLPVGMVPRPGIQYGSLSDESRLAFHEVIISILSSQGYLKLTSIMQLDDILNTLIQEEYNKGEITAELLKNLQNLQWAHGNYYISIWGKPQDKEPWGLNFGGHHMALNLTITAESIAVSPFFIGTDPAQVLG